MNAYLLRRYGGPVPRYTSYPTAPHFHAGVSAETYVQWLWLLDPKLPLSLYIHIPFCQQLCWYCGCHTKVANRSKPVTQYAETIAREIALVASHLAGRLRVEHIHWGGGTPTILGSDDLSTLNSALRWHFDIAVTAEHATEADPRTLTKEKAIDLVRAGVNRVSLGIQDFTAKVQKAINRVQPFETVKAAVGYLRSAGIDGINFDLMYGLPHQTVADVTRSVELALRLRPDRLAIFGYAHVPWMKAHQRLIDDVALPGGQQRMDQARAAEDVLLAHGYRRIGLDHFAKPDDPMTIAMDKGELRRNFQGYSTDTASTLLAFGASAIGQLPEGYVKNAQDLREYRNMIRSGKLATQSGIPLNPEDRMRGRIIQELMCTETIDLARATAEFGLDVEVLSPEKARLQEFAQDGLIDMQDDVVSMTELGRPFVRATAAVFDQHLKHGQQRHSRAV